MSEKFRSVPLNDMGQYFIPVDTTLRDGAQSPWLHYSGIHQFQLEDKMEIIDDLHLLGVRQFELFSPVVSPRDAEHFVALREYVSNNYPDIELAAHVRCLETDIKMALDAGADRLHIYLNASVFGQENSHHMDLPRILSAIKDVVGNVHQQYPDLYLRYSSEDYFRTDKEVTDQVFDVASQYVNTLGIPDTVGKATPARVRAAIRAIRSQYPGLAIECHFHNDRGRALENAEEAVINGAEYIDLTIWGIAERNGITPYGSLYKRLHERNPAYCNGFNIKEIYKINMLLGGILERPIPDTDGVNLTKVSHSAGPHTNAVLQKREVYEVDDLREFGVDSVFILNPYCGRHHIYYALREFYYYEVERAQSDDVFREFKLRLNEIGKNKKSPDQLLVCIAEEYGLKKRPDADTMQRSMFENLGGQTLYDHS